MWLPKVAQTHTHTHTKAAHRKCAYVEQKSKAERRRRWSSRSRNEREWVKERKIFASHRLPFFPPPVTWNLSSGRRRRRHRSARVCAAEREYVCQQLNHACRSILIKRAHTLLLLLMAVSLISQLCAVGGREEASACSYVVACIYNTLMHWKRLKLTRCVCVSSLFMGSNELAKIAKARRLILLCALLFFTRFKFGVI